MNRPQPDSDGVSLLQLVQNHTLDLRLASIFWLLGEKKASVIVAAQPRLAGKTTVLSALLQTIPPWYQVVSTRGEQEDFAFLSSTEPNSTYILVHEISDHVPAWYIWGSKVRTVFEALGRGYSLAATMHADTPEEIVELLQSDQVRLPPDLIMHLHLIVNLHMTENQQGPVRRVWRVNVLSDSPGPGESVRFLNLATWHVESDSLIYSDSSEVWASVARRLGMQHEGLEKDLLSRQQRLESWLEQGLTSTDQLRQLLAAHYKDQQRA